MMTADTIHIFERAGLGKAPFRFIGASREVYQAIPGDPSCPIQPAGSCDYCGQGIFVQCRIRSSDGRTFKVGVDCCEKTGDEGLRRRAASVKRAHEREARKGREARKLGELTELLARDDVRDILRAAPHPRGFVDRATGEPLTLLDQAEWTMKHAGTAGRVKLLAEVRAILEKEVAR